MSSPVAQNPAHQVEETPHPVMEFAKKNIVTCLAIPIILGLGTLFVTICSSIPFALWFTAVAAVGIMGVSRIADKCIQFFRADTQNNLA